MTISTLAYFAHVFGWTLIHFCWQGVVIALLLACVLSLFDSRWSRLRYAASCGALLLMVAVFFLTLQRVAVQRSAHKPALIIPGLGRASEATLQAQYQVMPSSWDQVAQSLEHYLPAVLAIWSIGFVVVLLRLHIGLLLAGRMASPATQTLPTEQVVLFEGVARRLGICRAIKLMRSNSVDAPTVVGWLRPMVLMPVGCFTGMSTLQMEAIFAHELAHIRRHDYLVIVLQSVVEALLFYHPAVWWVSRQIRKEREHCCDDLAAGYIGDRVTYARALYLLEERRTVLPAVTLSSNGGILAMRIKRLLNQNEPSPMQPSAAIAALGLLLAVLGICFDKARAEHLPVTTDRQAMLATLLAGRMPHNISTIPVDPPAALLTELHPPATPALRLAAAVVPAVAHDSADKPLVVPARVMAANCCTEKVRPIYPSEAREAKIQGVVELHAIIAKTGEVKGLQVVSGPKELYNSAIDAVRQWKYRPYLLNGQPVEVDTTVAVHYQIGDSASTGTPGECRTGVAGCRMPILLSGPSPEYTELAIANKITGQVLVRLLVNDGGSPQDIHVVQGLGHGLDEKAVEAVEQYKFLPAKRDGKATGVQLTLAVDFMRP